MLGLPPSAPMEGSRFERRTGGTQGGKIKVRKVTSASIRKRFLAEGKEILRRKGTMMQYSDEAVDRFIVRAKEAGVSFSDTEVFRA